jgi:hypothetical protein
MSNFPKQIYLLFHYSLLVDEEIYWFGEPLHNHWHLQSRHLFYVFVVSLFIPVFLVGILAIGFSLSFAQWLGSIITSESFIVIFILIIYAWRFKQTFDNSKYREATLDTPKVFYWWKPSYYAITSHRVLIFEQGTIRDYWHFLLDTPVLKKPKHQAASINLYSSTYAAKKKTTPVLDTLRGIPEDEADDVFAILKQARAEALEARTAVQSGA